MKVKSEALSKLQFNKFFLSFEQLEFKNLLNSAVYSNFLRDSSDY